MRTPSSLLAGPLAAVDMGSNSFRLEIGQLQHGRYRRIDYLKETVRLGAGLDDDGMLTEEAAQRGLECLRRFASRLEGFAPQQLRAVATQTLREARNRNAFLVRAQQALGHPIEVISGREEARLIYAGVSQLQPSEQTRLVVDIGGRSTEMILGQRRTPLRAESFQVGSVSLSLRFFGDGRLTEQAFRAAQIAAGAELEEALQPFAPQHWTEALGSSGTAGAVSQLLHTNGISDGRITPEGLRWCIDACVRAGHIDKLRLPALRPDRRAVLPGGLAILYTLATHFGIADVELRYRQRYLDLLVKAAGGHGVEVGTRIVFHGNAAQAIVEAAKEENCGLVFMGSHGRGGWSSAFLGSVTLKALTLTHLPILVDRPTAGEVTHAQALMEQGSVEP